MPKGFTLLRLRPELFNTTNLIMLGQTLKELRLKKGFSQSRLADKIGVKKLAILQIENGKTDPRLSTVVKLLNELLPVHPNGKKDYRLLHRIFKD